jgi:SAM-dependent methyltransferase
MSSSTDLLVITDKEIRAHGPGHALAVVWRQWRTERALARRNIHFRATDSRTAAHAYEGMNAAEFEAINGRQEWANWRTIPRAMNGHVPDRPLRVLDLGCGMGGSTRVLACYCPAGSRITGYEMVRALLDAAARRTYLDRTGRPAHITFVCQGITEPLREPDGTSVVAGSVDLVNASGIVGHHLNQQTVVRLVHELQRVLASGGIAMLDVGPTLPARALSNIMRAASFDVLGHYRSWWLDPTGQVVFRKRWALNDPGGCGLRDESRPATSEPMER